jgi:hypothetical protein
MSLSNDFLCQTLNTPPLDLDMTWVLDLPTLEPLTESVFIGPVDPVSS